jgi:type VI secretion system protein ImpH
MKTSLFADLLALPRTFFELMRRVDVLAAVQSKSSWSVEAVGTPVRRRPSWLRLQQRARMDFAAAEVADMECVEPLFEGEASCLRVGIRHFGLFAPYGPLPLYVTEHARHEAPVAFEQFFGHLTAELAWLDYKAWAQMHPVVGCDVPERGNSFVKRVSSVAAVELAADLGAGQCRETAKHIRLCRTHFAGLYAAKHRPLPCLAAMLRKYFHLPITVLPRAGGWLEIEKPDSAKPTVGRWFLGRRVFAPQAQMTLLVGPVSAQQFPRFHRGQALSRWLLAVAQDYASGLVDARLMVDVQTQAGMNGRIGAMRVGVDSWASPVDRLVRVCIHEPSMRSSST